MKRAVRALFVSAFVLGWAITAAGITLALLATIGLPILAAAALSLVVAGGVIGWAWLES